MEVSFHRHRYGLRVTVRLGRSPRRLDERLPLMGTTAPG
jgi:hypothetical protein